MPVEPFFHSTGDTNSIARLFMGTFYRKEGGMSAELVTRTEPKYCAYCKKQTPHKVVNPQTDGHGTGRDLRCTVCGSARLGEIQGFDAALM